MIRPVYIVRSLAAAGLFALAAAPAGAADAPRGTSEFEVPAELTDPAMAERFAKMLGSISKVMLDLPVGELQAAAEGRQAGEADKRRTVRDLAGGGPDLERRIESEAARAVPRLQAGMKAVASSLPSIAKALEQAAVSLEGSLDQATANLPTPGYPKR